MREVLSEKRLLLSWAAFFGLMFVPTAIATEFWSEVIEDEGVTDILALLFLAATSYFAFRLVVRRMVVGDGEAAKGKEG